MQLKRQPGLVILEHIASPSLVIQALRTLLVVLGIAAAGFSQYCVALCAIIAAVVLVPQKTEKVVAIENIGLQIERRGFLRYFTYSQQFIPAHKILDVVINEVFITFEVIHVLEAIVKDADRLVIVFENRLTLDQLETAWRALQGSMGAQPASPVNL